MMQYFKDCKTEQETKSAFRHLSKILHPDLGGTCELFREMNAEYIAHLKSLNGTYNSTADAKEGKRQYHFDETIEQDLVNMIRALQGLRLPETVEISLQGTWIWVKGVTRNSYGHYPLNSRHIPQLEALGLKLHTLKGECYYRNAANRCNNKGKSLSFDRIARRYKGYSVTNAGTEQVQ